MFKSIFTKYIHGWHIEACFKIMNAKLFLKSHGKRRVKAIKNEQNLKLELKTIKPEFTWSEVN